MSDWTMHLELPSPATGNHLAMVLVADSPDVVLNSKNSKNDGYGGLVSVGLILLAMAITVLFFFRNRSRHTPRQPEEPRDPNDAGTKPS